jgi:hypothetical protein
MSGLGRETSDVTDPGLTCDEMGRRMVEMVLLLAQPAEMQLEVFPADLVPTGDELVLTFFDQLEVADRLCRADAPFVRQRQHLDAFIDALEALPHGRDHPFWSGQGVRLDPRWEAVRSTAREALRSLGVADRRPHLWWERPLRG